MLLLLHLLLVWLGFVVVLLLDVYNFLTHLVHLLVLEVKLRILSLGSFWILFAFLINMSKLKITEAFLGGATALFFGYSTYSCYTSSF